MSPMSGQLINLPFTDYLRSQSWTLEARWALEPCPDHWRCSGCRFPCAQLGYQGCVSGTQFYGMGIADASGAYSAGCNSSSADQHGLDGDPKVCQIPLQCQIPSPDPAFGPGTFVPGQRAGGGIGRKRDFRIGTISQRPTWKVRFAFSCWGRGTAGPSRVKSLRSRAHAVCGHIHSTIA